jgi:hypothetical protein
MKNLNELSDCDGSLGIDPAPIIAASPLAKKWLGCLPDVHGCIPGSRHQHELYGGVSGQMLRPVQRGH